MSADDPRGGARAREVLLRVAEAVSAPIGPGTLERMTRQVVNALGTAGGVIAVLDPAAPSQVRTQVFLLRDQRLDDVCYDVRGTPCEAVVAGECVVIPRDLQRRFPDDAMLSEHGLVAYAGVPLRDPRGGLVGLLAILGDRPFEDPELLRSATGILAARAAAELERQQAEEELRRSQRLLEIASHLGQLGGWVVDLPDMTLTWSDEVCAIHDIPPGTVPTLEEAIGFYAPEHVDAIRDAFTACARDGVPYDLELQIVTATARRVWIRTIGQAVRDASGRIVRVHGAFQDISAQVEARARLEERERLIRIAAQVAGVAGWAVSWPGLEVEIAEEFYGLMGFDQAPTQNLEATLRLFPRPGREALEDALMRCLTEGTPCDIEVPIRAGDGALRWLRIRGEAERDEAGTILGARGAGQDVTVRKVAERALVESEARFRQLAGHIDEVFWLTDADKTRMLYVSPAYADVWGRSPAELAEDAGLWLAAIHEEDRAAVRAAIPRQTEGRYDVEYRVVRPDGEVRWVAERAFPIRGPDGAVFRIAGLARDITEQRRAQEALRLNEERFRLLSEATNDAIWDWDLVTGELWWSDSFAELFDYRTEDIGPTLESWTDRVHPEDRDAALASLTAAAESDATQWSAQYRLIRGDGRPAYVLDRGHILRDTEGRAVRMVGGITDLTERRELEHRLLQSQKMESVGQLAGGIAHDFNNLLTVILGTADFVRDSLPEDHPSAALLDDVRRAGERAANLTRQLLAFSRRQLMRPRLVDLNACVSSLLSLLEPTIGEHITIAFQPAPSLPAVRVDPGQIEQVLVNLVINARDAMPVGGLIAIETREDRLVGREDMGEEQVVPGPYVVIVVSDTGFGMPEAVRARVFEPFFTTKEVGKGTGLGLATVYGIVRQSAGYVQVESEQGEGTTFRVFLPVAEGAPAAEPRSGAPGEPDGGTETILVVEDELPVGQIAARALEAAGYTVLHASSGPEALALLESHDGPLDLVLSDAVMPGMSGPELAARLRSLRPSLKVLLTSGHATPPLSPPEAAGLQGPAGASRPEAAGSLAGTQLPFLAKPYSGAELRRRVRELLDADQPGAPGAAPPHAPV